MGHTSELKPEPSNAGHIRRQGHEASKVDSFRPRKYIHSGIVDRTLVVAGARQLREAEEKGFKSRPEIRRGKATVAAQLCHNCHTPEPDPEPSNAGARQLREAEEEGRQGQGQEEEVSAREVSQEEVGAAFPVLTGVLH